MYESFEMLTMQLLWMLCTNQKHFARQRHCSTRTWIELRNAVTQSSWKWINLIWQGSKSNICVFIGRAFKNRFIISKLLVKLIMFCDKKMSSNIWKYIISIYKNCICRWSIKRTGKWREISTQMQFWWIYLLFVENVMKL